MRNKSATSIADSEDLLDALRRAVARCTRAVAGKRNLEITFDAERPAVNANLVVLPPLPRRLSRRDCSVLRGASDTLALQLAHHDPKAHRTLRPAEAGAARIFDTLEQVRVEAIGACQMDGIAENIFILLQERYREPQYTGSSPQQVPIEDALGILARQYLIGGPFTALNPPVLTLWRPHIGDNVSALMQRLGSAVEDQAAFAAVALELAAELRQETVATGAAAEPVADEPEPQGEQEPGPIEGGDRSLGPAEGHKLAKDEAICDEPIYGTAEKAAAPGNDTLAEQLATVSQDNSEPSRRVVRGTELNPDQYRVFTREFDETARADAIVGATQLSQLRRSIDGELAPLESIVARLANRLQRSLEAQQRRLWEYDLEEDILDPARLTRIITDPMSSLLYKREADGSFRDTVVTLLLDNSGSMRGRPSMIVAICVDILARCLERCGIRSEILGFTTRTWRGGRAREKWIAAGSPGNPGRLNELLHVIYKSADAPWRKTKHSLGLMMRQGFHKENIDGEALAWAHQRLLRRSERRRILMMISDGAPVDDSTLAVAHGTGNYLERHLRHTIDDIVRRGKVELFAIGIGYDVTRLYPHAIMIKDIDDLGPALIGQLGQILKQSGHPDFGLRRLSSSSRTAREARPQPRKI
ncbi:cobaltochelatase CobT [Bradyrhizobium erythrophlei]|uniref:Cobaltochelatase CobT n=2 Tax=Bradyrhizobium erythrophlei TaxID=1437360 RepID=A0A1H4UK25_9BRAD|nr:cobaltochelatase CobT [Bradyrhizobium erythrophlei]